MLAKFNVVNSSQYMQISYHVVYLKLILCGISIIYLNNVVYLKLILCGISIIYLNKTGRKQQ